MTRSHLVAILTDHFPELTHTDVEVAVELLLLAVAKALAEGRRVEIRGFGTFATRLRRRRLGRNPMTGEEVEVACKPHTLFKPGRELRKRVNYPE